MADHAAWVRLAGEHREGCEWVATRAHRLPDGVARSAPCHVCGAYGYRADGCYCSGAIYLVADVRDWDRLVDARIALLPTE